MIKRLTNRRVLQWTLAITTSVGLAVALVGLVLLVNWYRQSADYPGSLYLGDNVIYKFSPLVIRRDSSYRSTDEFGKIYNWYSVGFDLGPEAYAQSQCILMARSFTDYRIIERDMSVTLCDTPNGRMIFVMRSLALRWR